MTTPRLINGNLYKIRAVSFGRVAEEEDPVSHDSNALENDSYVSSRNYQNFINQLYSYMTCSKGSGTHLPSS